MRLAHRPRPGLIAAATAVALLVPMAYAAITSNASGTPGTVATFAGGGGTLGDGGPAASAALNQPVAVTVDGVGNIFVADTYNCAVRSIAAGIIGRVAGAGGCTSAGDGSAATSAGLNVPSGVAVDAAGDVYIADLGNCRVRKVSGGTISTLAGTSVCGYSGDGGSATSAALMFPSGVAVDGAGNLFIADQGNCRVREVSGGVISTVAGTGACGYAGDGGTATSASLNGPFAVAVDALGNLYVSDTNNCRVREVTAGVITTVAGAGTCAYGGDGGAATGASLAHPIGLVLDNQGDLLIADSVNCRVRKVSAGVISTVAGNGTCAYSGDGGLATSAGIIPTGVAVDAAGNLYIADYLNCRLREVTGTTIATIAGSGSCASYGGDGGAATGAALADPRGIVATNSGDLYIADAYHCRVRKVTGGVVSTVAGNGSCYYNGAAGTAVSIELNQPTGVGLDSAGNLYIADTQNCVVRKVTGASMSTVAGSGVCGFAGDGGAPTSAELAFPRGVAIDASGHIYIADTANCRIREVIAGTITTVAGNGTCGYGGDGGAASTASINAPTGVALDAAGNLYIADGGNCRVRKVSGGTITSIAGNGTCGYGGDGGAAASASLNAPAAVALDAAGNVFIADSGSCRVRVVTGTTINTAAGNGSCGYGGDGDPASNAEMFGPGGVAVDGAGNLYIGDSGNNRVREVFAAAAGAPTATQTTTPTATAVPSGFTVSGHVYYGQVGVALPGALVTVCVTGGGTCQPAVTSAPDGSYVVPNVPAGSYDITAAPGGAIGPIGVSANTPGQDIVFAPSGTLSGHVYHDAAQAGNELANVRVLACLTVSQASGVCLPTVTSAADGSYIVHFVPDGTYTISVYPAAPYFQTSVSAIAVAGGGPTTQDLIVTGPPTGSISGHVYHDSAGAGYAVAGAVVWACPTNGTSVTQCSRALTDGGGAFTLEQLTDGTYLLTAVGSDQYLPGSIGSAIAGGGATAGQDIVIIAPEPPPTDVTVPTESTVDGVPSVDWSEPTLITKTGCAGGTAMWHLTMATGDLSGTMLEQPSGVYTASIPAVKPMHGASTVTITLDCPMQQPEVKSFNIWHDPSGLVRDTAGNAIAGATVTLWQGDNPDGPFTQVPDGSVLMSPANRRNPDVTNGDGHFGWDVASGYYKVRARKDGCVAPGNPAQTYAESGVMAIPPPVTDLDVRLDCTNVSGDGYADSLKLALGKNPAVYCAIMRADVDGSGAVNILDLGKVAAWYQRLIPPAPARLAQGPPPFGNRINIIDLSKMAGVYQKSVSACP